MEDQVIVDFDRAQRGTIRLMESVVSRLQVGMSEAAIGGIAKDMLPEFGFDGWFHPPEIRIGHQTVEAPVWRVPSPRVRLQSGEPLVLSLRPWAGNSYGDLTASLLFDRPDSPLHQMARSCTQATCGYASRWKCVGEVYVYARSFAANHRCSLANLRSIGHAILPPQGLLRFGYPRSAHALTWLRRHQVHFLNPDRMKGIYALRPHVTDGKIGACFGEMVLVDGDRKRILGRDEPRSA